MPILDDNMESCSNIVMSEIDCMNAAAGVSCIIDLVKQRGEI